MTQYLNKLFSRDKACLVSTLLIFFLMISNDSFAQDKKESEQIAKDILTLYKSNKGVVVTCENISTAIEIALQSEVRIYSNAKDQDTVDTARKSITAANLSATKIRVEKGPIETLNYPNFVANIVISSSQIEPQSLKEITRILRPEGFFIIIPNKNDKPTITLNDAKSFFTQKSPGNWQDPQKFGNGYVVQKAKLEGAADWSHYYRDPDNNRYSPDKLIRDPLRLLWFGEPVSPLGDLFLTQGFSAGGRLFLTDASPSDTSRARITCLDAYNGTQLWAREAGGTRYEKLEGVKDENLRILQLPGWVQPGSMAVSAEHIYLADNNECMVIDNLTGKDLTRIKSPAPTNPANCWRFVAFQDGLLFGYTNAPTPIPSKVIDPNPIKGGTPTLFALDQKTGAPKWVRGGVDGDELGSSFASPLAIGDNLIFLHSNKSLFAIDTRTGKTIWKTEALDDANTSTWWEGAVYKGKFFLYKFNFRTWPNKKKIATITFSTIDGKQEKEMKEDIANEEFFNSKLGFLGSPPNPRLGCNYGSAAGNLYFHRGGYFLEKEGLGIMSPTNSKSYGGFRAGCGVGAIPANGLVHLLPNGLGCGCAALQGTAALESDPEPENTYANFQPKPEFINTQKINNEKPATEIEWPTYYADNARSGVTKQDLSKVYSLAWEVKVKGTPTPSIAVGSQIFFGSTDECVYSLSSSTGAITWKFQTTGAIQAAPCYWNGRIFVGSDDGWLYALAAEDGKLLWKIRGGPSNRKQINFENMISPWPIRQGIAVNQGQVYFTAGLIPGAEIHSYCVDAVTGNVNWRIPVGKSYIIPTGYLTLLSDSLMIPSPGSASIYHPIVLGLKDGSRQKAQVTHGDFAELRHVAGLETEELGYTQGFIVFGGSEGKRRGYRDGFGYSSRIDKYDGQYSLFPEFYDEGKTKIKGFNPMADGHSFAPLFTTKNVVMRFKNNLICINRADLFKFLETREPTGKEKDVFNQWCLKDLPCGKAEWAEIAIGKKEGDAVTVIAGGPKGICAVNMQDGKINWSLNWEGSSTPAAIANTQIYISSPDGTIRALKPK